MAESPDLTALPDPPVHPQHQQYRGSFSLPSSAATYQPPGDPFHEPEELHLTSPQQLQSPQSFYPNLQQHQQHQQLQQQAYLPPSGRRRTLADPDEDYHPDDMGRTKRTKTEPDDQFGVSSTAPLATNDGVEVKTKFPVARIKRIMQADEDVGKVAQVTPVVVSKALELFMISLVTKSATEARSRNSKRVTAAHMKQAVLKDQQFDFLSDIVGKVPDAPAPRDQAEGGAEGDGKKRRGGGRRKKKDSSDDDMM